MSWFASSSTFYALAIASVVLLVLFPIMLRRQYVRRRQALPNAYWIWSAIGLECGAIAAFLVSVFGIAGDDIQRFQPQIALGMFAVVTVLATIGLTIKVCFDIREAIRQTNR